MRKKLRANDDLRTRFRPSCKNKSLEVNDGIETLGVTRDGDFIVKQNRNPAVSKFHRAIQRNEPGRVRKSRRRGCETPLFTESFGTFCETRADGSGVCQSGYQGAVEATFFHPIVGSRKQITSLGSIDIGVVNLDEWYHVTLVRDEDFLALYINGQAISASMDPLGNGLRNGESNGLYIGGVRASSWVPDAIFNGRLDQICAWSRVLSPEEASDLYFSGQGKKYTEWSDELKQSTDLVIEFDNPLSVSGGAVVGDVINLVNQSTVEVQARLSSIPRNLVQEGKVSNFSFTPAYIDDLTYPIADMANAKASVSDALGNSSPHQVLFFPGDFSTQDSFSLSAWVSPHGMAYSKGTKNQLDNVNLGEFDFNGDSVQKTYGVVFSDYEGYNVSNGGDANFTLAFRGTYKNDPNASSLIAPSKANNLTVLPEAPGVVNNLTAEGPVFLQPSFSFNHAAMSLNQKVVSDITPVRFINSSNMLTVQPGQRAVTWRIELNGTVNADIRSDDGLGATLATFMLGQQKPSGVGSEGSWCLFFNPENHEGFRPSRNTFFANNFLDKQTYHIVFSANSLVGRYRWQSQTNNFVQRFPIFGTHESPNNEFGVDLTLINDMKDLSFRTMNENGDYQELIVSDFTAGIGQDIPVTLVTLNVNYDSSEPSSIFINGHHKGDLASTGKPSHIVNNQYQTPTDSISIAEGPTIGTRSSSKPTHYTRMNLHELAQLHPTTQWFNHPDSNFGPIPQPVHEKGEGFLAHKWSIQHFLPDNHPFKNRPPAL